MDDFLLSYHEDGEDSMLKQKIYDTICDWYPIGLKSDSSLYRNHSKFIKFSNLIKSKNKNSILYQEWEEYLQEIQRFFPNYLVHGNTKEHLPCFSLYLQSKEINETGNIIYTKQIFILRSLIMPIYTLYGQHNVVLKSHGDRGRKYNFEPLITIASKGEYESIFSKIQKFNDEYWRALRFIPMEKLLFYLKGLELPHYKGSKQGVSLYQALFDVAPFDRPSMDINQLTYINLRTR